MRATVEFNYRKSVWLSCFINFENMWYFKKADREYIANSEFNLL